MNHLQTTTTNQRRQQCGGDDMLLRRKEFEKSAGQASSKFNLAKNFYESNSVEMRERMIQGICYYNDVTQTVAFEYPMFKVIACPEIYKAIADRLYEVLDRATSGPPTVEPPPKYFMFLNLKGVTISSVQRYIEFIQTYCNQSIMGKYYGGLEKVIIVNAPSILNQLMQLLSIFIPNYVKEKIIIQP